MTTRLINLFAAMITAMLALAATGQALAQAPTFETRKVTDRW